MGITAHKVSTTVYLEEEQAEGLRQLKKATGVPIAELIRQGVDKIIRKNLEVDHVVSFVRASGECICDECGDFYRRHPSDKKNLGYDDQPYLRVLCGGQRVKL